MRPRLIIAAAGIVVAAVALAAVLAIRTTGDSRSKRVSTCVRVRPNSLVLVGNEGRLRACVRLLGKPGRVAYSMRAFWVVVPEKGLVVRVDSRTYAVRKFSVGEHPYDVAVGGGAVWVPDHDLQRLFRLDPETGATRMSPGLGGPAVTARYGLDSAWAIVAPGDLKRIDPATLEVIGTTNDVAYAVEGSEPKLLSHKDTLFVVSPATSTLTVVDRDGHVFSSDTVNGLLGGTLLGGNLWVATDAGVGPFRGSERVALGSNPVDIAGRDLAIWVALYGESSVRRLNDVKTLARARLAFRPVAIAAGPVMAAVSVGDTPGTETP